MGVERVVFHSVRCDKCNKWLDDYKENISKARPNRIIASSLAKENGFKKVGANIWLCPKCVLEFRRTCSERDAGFNN